MAQSLTRAPVKLSRYFLLNPKEEIMRLRVLHIALFLMLAAIPAWAQTSDDLNSKYGASQQSYEMRPGIFMIVTYGDDGQVCEMSIEKRHIKAAGTTINVEPTIISADEMKEIVDELVPLDQRGEKSSFPSLISVSGGAMHRVDEYENVNIISFSKTSRPGEAMVLYGTVAIVITWKNRSCKSKVNGNAPN